MPRYSAIAVGGALVTTLSSTVAAEVTWMERVRVQGGFITEERPAPAERLDDWHIGVLPELMLSASTERSEVDVGYGFSGALHTEYPNQTAHTLTLSGRFDLSRRTTLLTSAFLSKTSMTNLLLTTPTAQAPTSLLPSGTSTDIVNSNVGQALAYELTEEVRVEQTASATFYTALEPAPPLDSFGGLVGASIERSWDRDAIGVEASGGYSLVRAAPPFQSQDFVLVSGGPRWRRDWSRTINTNVAGGAAAIISPDGSTAGLVAPFARGALLYTIEPGLGFGVTATTGVTPNPLTGQAIRAHQASFNAFTPIVAEAQVYGAATIGYMRGSFVDLGGRFDQHFHAATADVEVLWRPRPLVEVFARYTFLGQLMDDTGAAGFPTFLRDSILIGFGISSRAGGIDEANMRARRRAAGGGGFGQRVDRADVPAGPSEDRPDALQEQRERPPEGVGGTRWNVTRPEDADEQGVQLTPRPGVQPPRPEERRP